MKEFLDVSAQTLWLFGGIALFNLFVWSPVLLFSSVRRLFEDWPTENLILNYILGMGGFTVLHSAVLVAVVVFSGGLEGVEAFWGLGLITAGVGVLGWAIASFVFPRLDWWEPSQQDEVDGRVALGIGLIWYLVSTAIGLFLLMVVLIALFFPG